jgi:hypothetical protein
MIDQGLTRLSSSLTFVFKFIFPTTWLLGFSAATLLLLTRPDERGLAVPVGMATILGALFFSGACFPLKTVFAGPNGLRVGNFIREIEIPYAQIASVQEHKLLNTRLTTIWLHGDSPFGSKLRFQPYTHLTLLLWKDHPAVVELRTRIAVATKPRT